MTNANRRAYLKTWQRQHGAYERRAFKIIRKGFLRLAQRIPTGNINKLNAAAIVGQNITQDDIFEIIAQAWTEIGFIHGKRTIAKIQSELGTKNAFGLFNDQYQKEVLYFLRRFAGYRIVTIDQQYRNYIVAQIAKELASDNLLDELPIQERLYRAFRARGFYRWQMARIARTETTGAANYAAVAGGKITGIKQKKIWISNPDDRTRQYGKGDRFDHVLMDGQETDPDGLFSQRGVFLRFPGDPQAEPHSQSAGMVINCRCAVEVVPLRDGNGNLQLG